MRTVGTPNRCATLPVRSTRFVTANNEGRRQTGSRDCRETGRGRAAREVGVGVADALGGGCPGRICGRKPETIEAAAAHRFRRDTSSPTCPTSMARLRARRPRASAVPTSWSERGGPPAATSRTPPSTSISTRRAQLPARSHVLRRGSADAGAKWGRSSRLRRLPCANRSRISSSRTPRAPRTTGFLRALRARLGRRRSGQLVLPASTRPSGSRHARDGPIGGRHPAGLSDPGDFGRVGASCSEHARYLTGTAIQVDAARTEVCCDPAHCPTDVWPRHDRHAGAGDRRRAVDAPGEIRNCSRTRSVGTRDHEGNASFAVVADCATIDRAPRLSHHPDTAASSEFHHSLMAAANRGAVRTGLNVVHAAERSATDGDAGPRSRWPAVCRRSLGPARYRVERSSSIRARPRRRG